MEFPPLTGVRSSGMILLATRGYRSWVEPQRRVIYVEALATAPWNRSQLQVPQYRLVGGTLMEFARYRSEAIGYGGLVALHSFPGAEGFYTQLGLLNCGADPDYDNLVYFEWYRPRPPREVYSSNKLVYRKAAKDLFFR